MHQVKLWSEVQPESKWQCSETIKLPDAVTAVDATRHRDQILLAVGLDSGAIHIYAIGEESLSSSEIGRLESS